MRRTEVLVREKCKADHEDALVQDSEAGAQPLQVPDEHGAVQRVRLKAVLRQVLQGVYAGHVRMSQREVLLWQLDGVRQGVPEAGGGGAQVAATELLFDAQGSTEASSKVSKTFLKLYKGM